MIYLAVIAISAAGMFLLFLTRGLLRSRNVRRIARAVRQGTGLYHASAKHLSETPPARGMQPRRRSAADLQKVRTLLRDAEKASATKNVRVAERALIQALTIDPGARDVKAELAHLYLDTERAKKAEALYHELLARHPDPTLFADCGRACSKQGKFAEACAAFRMALEHDGGNPARCADCGRACIAAERFAEAAPLLERAVKASPRNLELLHLLGNCLLTLGETDRAGSVFRRIHRLDPRDTAVKEKLRVLTQAISSPPLV